VQVNINPTVNLTFAACLRSILRQDPDVILVGEIRDVETAQIAIQAALTGHLVYSTLHTNSAAATITRLIDMGVEPFLITSTLEAVLGQRLVRTICPSCKTIYVPTDEELLDFSVARDEVSDVSFYRGAGCDDCHFTGYKGRMGIFECLGLDDDIRELVLARATTDEIHALAVHKGMQTMRNDGWLKICLGVTTFEEVARQTPRESADTIRQEMESAKRSLEKIQRTRLERDAEDHRDDSEESSGTAQPAAAPAADSAPAPSAEPAPAPAAAAAEPLYPQPEVPFTPDIDLGPAPDFIEGESAQIPLPEDLQIDKDFGL